MRIKEGLMMMAMSTALLGAAEYTVKEGLFKQKVSLKATVVPTKPLEIKISPKSWSSYPILDLVEHGAKVSKGDVLIDVNTEKLDETILEMEEQRKVDRMNLEKLEQELAELELNTKIGLEKAERKYARSVEDYKYFREVELEQMVRGGNLALERAAWSLASTEEELKQLKKMYDADGLTEETEEIILTRAKNAVKSGKYGYDNSILNSNHRLKVVIPRMEKDKEVDIEQAKMMFETAKKNLPRSLELKCAAVAKAKREDARKFKKLEEAKADRNLAKIVAPVNGYVYWGEFNDGGWSRDLANKTLKVGASVPAHKVLMTIVPSDSEYMLGAYVDERKASLLEETQKGMASVSSNGWLKFPATVESVATVPVKNGSWVVKLKPEFVDGIDYVAGSTVNVDLVTYENSKAITIPLSAVSSEDDGSYSVQVKMADGKSEKKSLKVGQVSNGDIEVLGGVEAGQVIIYKEAKKK